MGLSAQLVVMVIVAFLISVAVFVIADTVVKAVIDDYLEDTDYIESQNVRYVAELQQFVDENNVSSTDRKRIEEWVRSEEIIGFEIYDGDTWMYTTSRPKEGEFMEKDMTGATELKVSFSDGDFNVLLYGNYSYKFYYYALACELIFCFFVFLAIMMYGIRKMISYAKTLKNEIEILEGGDLGYNITIKGNSELTDLALSIESLRKAVLEQFEREEELKKVNNRIIADMSHDIRTPLTTIMIYQDAIKYKKYKDEKQLAQYAGRIGDKLEQIKYLTDTIFSYSLETSETGYRVPVDVDFGRLIFDVTSEMAECLSQRGFEVISDIMEKETPEATVRIYREDVDRIVNNILSNMLKYADETAPVCIGEICDEDYASVVFRNRIARQENGGDDMVRADSEKIGLKNVRNMMKKMGGRCEIEEDGDDFVLLLKFKKI